MVASIKASLVPLFAASNPIAEFGIAFEIVIALCVLNTLGTLWFVWRIFREKPASPTALSETDKP